MSETAALGAFAGLTAALYITDLAGLRRSPNSYYLGLLANVAA